MKKLLALVIALVVVLSLSVLPAMADGLNVGTYDPASAGEYEMGFGWWGNQVRDEVTKAAADFFTENYPNIKFNLNSQVWNNYWSLMSTYAANNDLPDIMQQDYAFIEQWAQAGDLLDLTPYIESGALDLSKVPQNIIDTGKVGEGIYAVCAGVNAPALLYNKTLTDELGIEVPKNITWDQFAEISRKVFAEKGVGAVYGEGNSENQPTYYARGLGYTAFWGDEGINASVEQMTGYYQRIMDAVAEGWMFDTDKMAGVNLTDLAQSPLVYGTTNDVRTWAAFAFSNQIAAFQTAANADGIELGITNWASDDPVASNYMKPSQFFSITTDTKNPDLAVAFLNYLINDVQANTILRAERGVPANGDVAAAIADEVTKVDATYGLVVDYLAFVAENSSPIFPPLPAYSGQVNADVIQRLTEEAHLLNPTVTAEECAKDLIESTAEIASEY
ncbi:MAG: extracellular solute-binding protein [Clostridia bacterium]|nr:extracellular solute-binding protein [Clostridia bacterium]